MPWSMAPTNGPSSSIPTVRSLYHLDARSVAVCATLPVLGVLAHSQRGRRFTHAHKERNLGESAASSVPKRETLINIYSSHLQRNMASSKVQSKVEV